MEDIPDVTERVIFVALSRPGDGVRGRTSHLKRLIRVCASFNFQSYIFRVPGKSNLSFKL
jgi:hypothetical protein